MTETYSYLDGLIYTDRSQRATLRFPFQSQLHQGIGEGVTLSPGILHLPLIHTL